MAYHTVAVEPRTSESFAHQDVWRHLWSHAAYQIVSSLASHPEYEQVSVGAGWGLRHQTNHRHALLIHPNVQNQPTGELALTVVGSGTHVIPRCGRSYLDYVAAVADIVETTARTHLSHS